MLFYNTNAQITFEKTFNDTLNQFGFQILQTYDNGYLITAAGYINNPYDLTYFLLKTDSIGNIIWKKQTSSTIKRINKTIQTKDSCYIFAGRLNSNLFLYKISPTGDSVWLKEYTTSATYMQAFSVTETKEGDIIVVGEDFIGTNYCCYPKAFRTDSVGNFLNAYNIPEQNGRAYDVSETNDSNLIISFSSIYYGPPHPGLIKSTKSGTNIWSKSYSGSCECNVNIIENDNFLLVGSQQSKYNQPYLIKTNSNGEIIWDKNNSDFNIFNPYYNAAIDFVEGFLLIGYYTNDNKDLKILKLNNDGDSIWSRTYGGFGDDMGNAIISTKDSGFAIIGYSTSYSKKNKQIYFIKTNKEGNITSIKNIPLIQFKNINIFPNPANDLFSLFYPKSENNKNREIIITNALGNIVYIATIKQERTDIYTQDWKEGLYFIQVKNGDIIVDNKKLIIQR